MKTMNKIAALGLALACTSALAQEPEGQFDLMVFGTSKHFNTKKNYNERNYGLGLEYSSPHAQLLGGEGSWLVGGFAVHDSCRRTGGAVYAGYRLTYPLFDSGMRFEATLRGGWLKDCDWNAPALVPSVGVGYKSFTAEATFLPKIGQNKVPTAILWFRWRF